VSEVEVEVELTVKVPRRAGTFDYTVLPSALGYTAALPMALRVLLADDHPAMMTAVERLIAPPCEIVGRISDGTKVLDSLARLGPDVLLVDINMPGLDGLEICRRTVRAFPHVRVIVMTAEADAGLAEASRDAGATAFVAKLAAADELPAAIARVTLNR